LQTCLFPVTVTGWYMSSEAVGRERE